MEKMASIKSQLTKGKPTCLASTKKPIFRFSEALIAHQLDSKRNDERASPPMAGLNSRQPEFTQSAFETDPPKIIGLTTAEYIEQIVEQAHITIDSTGQKQLNLVLQGAGLEQVRLSIASYEQGKIELKFAGLSRDQKLAISKASATLRNRLKTKNLSLSRIELA